MFRIKRVYEQPAVADGCRVLDDRLWPRGLAKDAAALDEWLKHAAPSPALRTWFGHDPARWEEFSERYRRELAALEPERRDALDRIRRLEDEHGTMTLLIAARDPVHYMSSFFVGFDAFLTD